MRRVVGEGRRGRQFVHASVTLLFLTATGVRALALRAGSRTSDAPRIGIRGQVHR